MDERAELNALIQQAAEHLRYYRELGLTHIGSSPVEADPSASIPSVELVSAPSLSPPTEKAVEKQGEFMAKSKDKKAETAPAEISLFGELAAPPVEEQYGNETLDDIRAEM